MSRTRVLAILAYIGAFCAIWVHPSRGFAINIVIDYTYDTTDFFGAGNPSGALAGAQARAALEATASFYSGILADDFSSIIKPPDFHSATLNGVASWDWTMTFVNPSTGAGVALNNQVIAADEYRIYAGARSLASPTLGSAIAGGAGWNLSSNGGLFTAAEIGQLNAITTSFSNAVSKRGETSGFAAWGGAVTFDRDGSTNWHYNHTTLPTAGTSDFYSVTIHELAHVLGLGASVEWESLASGALFTGAAATAAFGSPPPLEGPNPPRTHWAASTMSNVFGTNTAQEAAMDPTLAAGIRKRLTSLDAAALVDIGWTVVPVPEPASVALVAGAAWLLVAQARRRRPREVTVRG